MVILLPNSLVVWVQNAPNLTCTAFSPVLAPGGGELEADSILPEVPRALVCS